MTVSDTALDFAGAGGPLLTWTACFDAAKLREISRVDPMCVDSSLLRLRDGVGSTTTSIHHLPSSSLSEMQKGFEAGLDREVDKTSFRRKTDDGVLAGTANSRSASSHRPIRLYRIRGAYAAETYLTPYWSNCTEREAANL